MVTMKQGDNAMTSVFGNVCSHGDLSAVMAGKDDQMTSSLISMANLDNCDIILSEYLSAHQNLVKLLVGLL